MPSHTILKTLKYSITILIFFATIAYGNTDKNEIQSTPHALETVYTFDSNTPPGNIAISPTGRIFLSIHGFFGEPKYRVVEVLKNGATKPYPTVAWASTPIANGPGLTNVLGLRVDRDGILWMLDGQSPSRNGRIVGWDTTKEILHKTIILKKPATTANSFLNDLAVDKKHNMIYVADSSGALIVVDIKSGRSRRLLNNTLFTSPEKINMVIDGKTITLGDKSARIGINPITIDAKNEWLYFAPMSSTSLYRIQIQDLLNTKLTDAMLIEKVARYGDKTISDGSTIDNQGNVYISSITENAIGVTDANGNYRVLFQDDKISWPDGFAVSADGNIYFTVNELHRSPVLNNGKNETKGKFKIMRFTPLAKATQGR